MEEDVVIPPPPLSPRRQTTKKDKPKINRNSSRSGNRVDVNKKKKLEDDEQQGSLAKCDDAPTTSLFESNPNITGNISTDTVLNNINELTSEKIGKLNEAQTTTLKNIKEKILNEILNFDFLLVNPNRNPKENTSIIQEIISTNSK
ncbi:uncharacterized protein LOC109613959 isoform X1 [Musca domestica]|uniref:Uncharacterized protein LOC109613959 isoform X1 n=1 Tax=Musca domestica TaxID=7370 RepID=A0ABM3VEG4_MUSDO|nr:uncharacterized protein LOC109613959 isoform X1 [Musca domestica]